MKAYNTTFYKQSEKDIWDEINDWSITTFICVMKDNSIQRFNGYLDENYEGEISQNIDCITNDDYSLDDIRYWSIVDKKIFDAGV